VGRKRDYFEVKIAQRKIEGDLVGLRLFCPEHPAYDAWAFHVLRFAANFNLKFEWQASRIVRLYPAYSKQESRHPAVGVDAVDSFLKGYFSYLLHGFVDSCVNEFHLPHGSWGRPYGD
jgi:hypothetical protein